MVPSIQVVLDSLALLAAGLGSYYALVFYSYKTVELYYSAICFNWLVNLLLFQFADLYTFDSINRPRRVIDRILIAITVTFVLMLAAAFSLKISDVYSRNWLMVFYAATVAGVITVRLFTASMTAYLTEQKVIVRRVAVYGRPEQITAFARHLKHADHPIVTVNAVFFEDNNDSEGLVKLGYPLAGGLQDLVTWIRADQVDDVVLALPWSDAQRIKEVVEILRELPTNIMLSGDVASYSVPMAPAPNYFDGGRTAQLVGKPLSGWDVVLKTLMDYTIALTLMVILLPFFIVLAILIKLDSPGPILFKQPRLGFNNRQFSIYKFRSMVHQPEQTGKTVQATAGDKRVTRIGRLLRSSSIDELPQLLNVLNGTMSVVGPRPHAIDHNEDYARKIRGYFARHRTKPGITGLAQVKGYRGPTETDDKMEKRVQYDIEYIENWSLLLDIKILLMTIRAVLFPKNAV
jgi:Undecaprenyl-phosphate glucose phosphotransferase